MECFRIDESGYTGFDLLNADQHFQGASAIAIGDDDAARLIREHFPRLQAAELKYKGLSRRPGNNPRLLALLREVLGHHKCVTYVCDKRFLLILMFLDHCVEPFYHLRGIDFYEDGQNYALASLLAVAGPTLLGRDEFDAMLAAFQLATREKTPGSLRDLVTAVRRTRWQELPEALGPLAQYGAPECLAAVATPGVSTDAAMVVLQSLISRMERMSAGPYRVEHDRSKNLATYHGLLRRFIDHTGEIELRQTEIASFRFPLKLIEVTEVDSRTSPAVQVADALIGATLDAMGTMTGLRAGGLDPEALFPMFAEDQFIHLTPSIDFEAQRRFRQGTQASAVIDYFAANFAVDDRRG